jgi:hypothetical protein
MDITLHLEPFILMFLMACGVYLTIIGAYSLRDYRKDRRSVTRYSIDVGQEGVTASYRTADSKPKFPWAPSRNLLMALLGLHLIPCLWGPFCIFAFLSIWPQVAIVLLLLTAISTWSCRRARKALPGLEAGIAKRWHLATGAVIMMGVSLLVALALGAVLTQILGGSGEDNSIYLVFPYTVAGVTLLLGAVMWKTAKEVAAAETSLVRSE